MLVFMRTKEENFAKYHQYNGDEMTSIFDVLTTKMEVISIIVYIVFLLWIMDATNILPQCKATSKSIHTKKAFRNLCETPKVVTPFLS